MGVSNNDVWLDFLKMNPNGLSLEMDVIIMFHKRFLTKNDRASKLLWEYF